jgi:peptidoglycan/LPS O-acetylase OafA/YrhL
MSRQPALDGLRGLAILWVLSYHLFALPAKAAALGVFPSLLEFTSNGWMGVNLFFVLSGFLITRGLVDQPRDRYYFGSFIARRVFRIAPAYALLLLSYPAARFFWPASAPGAQAVFNPAIPLWSYVAFVQNFFMIPLGSFGNDWLRVLWSLALEVQFYVFICIALYMIPRRRTAAVLWALVAACVGFRYAVYLTMPHADTALVVLLPSRLDSFLLGGLLVLLPRGEPGVLRTAAAAAVLAGCVGYLHAYATGAFGPMTRYAVPLYYTVISVGCAALLDLCASPVRPVAWLMESDLLGEAGQLSYFVYLFHVPFALALFHFALHSAPSLGSLASSVAMTGAAAAVFAAARFSDDLLETPLIRFSHTLARRPRVPAAAAVKPDTRPGV